MVSKHRRNTEGKVNEAGRNGDRDNERPSNAERAAAAAGGAAAGTAIGRGAQAAAGAARRAARTGAERSQWNQTAAGQAGRSNPGNAANFSQTAAGRAGAADPGVQPASSKDRPDIRPTKRPTFGSSTSRGGGGGSVSNTVGNLSRGKTSPLILRNPLTMSDDNVEPPVDEADRNADSDNDRPSNAERAVAAGGGAAAGTAVGKAGAAIARGAGTAIARGAGAARRAARTGAERSQWNQTAAGAAGSRNPGNAANFSQTAAGRAGSRDPGARPMAQAPTPTPTPVKRPKFRAGRSGGGSGGSGGFSSMVNRGRDVIQRNPLNMSDNNVETPVTEDPSDNYSSSKMSKKNMAVIQAFLNREPATSNKLNTDGSTIDILALGGNGVAWWDGETINYRDSSGRIDQALIRTIQKQSRYFGTTGVAESKLTEGVLDDMDDDGFMAKRQLYDLAKYSVELHRMIQDTDNLEPWVQAKITKASDYIDSVKHFLEYQGVRGAEDVADMVGLDDIEGVDQAIDTMAPTEQYEDIMEFAEESSFDEWDILGWALRHGVITEEMFDDPSPELYDAAAWTAEDIGEVDEAGSSDISIWVGNFVANAKQQGIVLDGANAHVYESDIKARKIYEKMISSLKGKK
jgi:hypothetical protein